MKFVLRFLGMVVAVVASYGLVWLGVAYILIFLNFSGPEQVVERYFRTGLFAVQPVQ